MSYQSYKFRIYPNKDQEKKLTEWINSSRFVWNYMLDLHQKNYTSTGKGLNRNTMINLLVPLKKNKKWLYDTYSKSLQNKINDLSLAFDRFYKGLGGLPKFKKKNIDNSGIRFDQINDSIKFSPNRVKIPKLGWINTRLHRKPEGIFKSLTITKDVDHWYISCLFKVEDKINLNTDISVDKVIGIDLGLDSFIALSDGTKITNPRITKKRHKKKARLQRQIARKQKGSKNRDKARIKYSKYERKTRNIKTDFINKTINAITKQYDVVCLEDLNIKGMMKNKRLSRSIQDTSWGLFVRKISEKMISIKIDRFSPSTKTCSSCGKLHKMPLEKRTMKCDCGLELDRDINAAINIKEWGINELNRVGTTRIYACGDTSNGDISGNNILDISSYVSKDEKKQEKVLDENINVDISDNISNNIL